MCTCCADQRMPLYRLTFLRIVFPSKISVSFLRGMNGNRQCARWVIFCKYMCRVCRHTKTLWITTYILSIYSHDEPQMIVTRDEKIRESDRIVTSCIALYIMALWPGCSSVSNIFQHRQCSAPLISDQRRSLSTAEERPESNDFSRHSVSTVSWQGERNSDECALGWNSPILLKTFTYRGVLWNLG